MTTVDLALVRLWQPSFHAQHQVQTREQDYLRSMRSCGPRKTALNAQTQKTSLGSAMSDCSHDPSTDDNNPTAIYHPSICLCGKSAETRAPEFSRYSSVLQRAKPWHMQ